MLFRSDLEKAISNSVQLVTLLETIKTRHDLRSEADLHLARSYQELLGSRLALLIDTWERFGSVLRWRPLEDGTEMVNTR